jgi:hypothetical protein
MIKIIIVRVSFCMFQVAESSHFHEALVEVDHNIITWTCKTESSESPTSTTCNELSPF